MITSPLRYPGGKAKLFPYFAELIRTNESLRREISERRQAEQALRVSEQHLRRLFDERERLVRDMHDNIVQAIYVTGLNLEGIELLIQQDPIRATAEVAKTVADLNGVIRDIRRYIDRSPEQIGVPPDTKPCWSWHCWER